MYKEFIPYEQALELKELGFDEPCFAAMDMYSNIDYGSEMYNWIKNSETVQSTWAALPLYQQAFRWFREKYELNHIIIFQSKTKTYDAGIIGDIKNFVDYSLIFNTYEEAELACLKKLIEIAKNNKTYNN